MNMQAITFDMSNWKWYAVHAFMCDVIDTMNKYPDTTLHIDGRFMEVTLVCSEERAEIFKDRIEDAYMRNFMDNPLNIPPLFLR